MYPMSSDPMTMLKLATLHQEELSRRGEWKKASSARTEHRTRRLPALLAGVRPSWHLLHLPRHSPVA
jgi:hypothetical protein